jgi:hypothetical protein
MTGDVTLKPPTHLAWDDRLPDEDKKLIAELNGSLDRLNVRRAVRINVGGPFARSKIAWKLASYQHNLLHRIIALMDGGAVTWNNRSTLSAILSARALMESIAVMASLENRVQTFLEREDLGQLDALATQGIFATRDPQWIEEHPDTRAVNMLTYVDWFDKRASGFRRHYDLLSERCHPNSWGHNFMFSKLDRSDGSIAYYDERNPDHNGEMILAALAVFPLVESMMTRLDDLILEVSDLQHRLHPVGGHEPSATFQG